MPLTDEPDELLDLVNDRDVVVGTVRREEVAQQMMNLPGLVRSSNLFIMNNKGEVWVPRRSPNKKTAPNGLDYSAGEHVKAGETYTAAMIRGMQEELNMTVTEQQLEFVAKISNAPVGVPYFNAIYLYRGDEAPNYNKDDFVSYEWLTPEALAQRLASGEPAKRDMALAVRALQETKKG
ncbi:MAG TPA: NUDIX domain-containing protein [Candidatus Saccharimonadales bacterium]